MGYAVKAIGCVLDTDRFAEFFFKVFRVEFANTGRLRNDAFRLRYRVYCKERGFERSEAFPDQLESDEFDDGAVHAIVRHRETGIVVGAVRLILRQPADPRNLLPLEQACGGLLDKDQISRLGGYRHSVGEVSRFAVSKGAIAEVAERTRSNLSSHSAVDGYRDILGANPFQSIALGLISVLFKMSAARGIEHWYALMEPALVRHLSRLGLHFTRIGPMVNHHGKRQPMAATVQLLRQEIRRKNPQLHQLIEFQGEPVANCRRQAYWLSPTEDVSAIISAAGSQPS